MRKKTLVYLNGLMGSNVTYPDPLNDPGKAAAINEQIHRFLKDHSFPINITRKTILYQQGDVAEQLFYIFKGALAQFVKLDNVDYTTKLLGPGYLTSNILDFYYQQQIPHTTQAMSSCILYAIHHSSFRKLVEYFPEALQTLGIYMSGAKPPMVERSILMQWTTKDRFQYIVQHHTDLLKLVPHKTIAQFLHMSAEQFSRLLHEDIK